MKRDNPLVKLSIYGIKKIWHGKFGRDYNTKHNVLCRFHPSCSNFTILALQEHGFFKGWYLGMNRIWRCNLDNTQSTIDYPY